MSQATVARARPHALRHAKWVVAALMLLALMGWLSGTPGVGALGPDFPPIRPSSIMVLALLTVALRGLQLGHKGRGRYLVVGAALGIATVAFLGITFGFGNLPAWPMSLDLALSYWLLSAMLVLATLPGKRTWELTQAFSMAVGVMALVGLVGLTFSIARLDSTVSSVGMTLPIALALLAASFSVLVMRPDARLVQVLEHDSPGASMVRRLVPAAIAVALLVGWLETLGQRLGWFEIAESEVVVTVFTIAAVVGLILWISGKVDELNLSRSQAELRAETQQRWLEVTLANVGDAVITVNHDMRIGFLNRAAEALLETSAAAAVGGRIDDFLTLVDETSGARLECPIRAASLKGHPVLLEGEPALLRKDGSRRAVDVTANPVGGDDEQGVNGVLVLSDVTIRRARVQAERQAHAALDRRVADRTRALDQTRSVLRENTALLHTIAASTPELIVAKGRDGRIMMVNAAALQFLGLSRAQVIGRKEQDISNDAAELHCIVENDRKVIETGRPIVVEELRTTRRGSRTFLVTKSPLRDIHGKVFGLVEVARDITERKRAQNSLEKLLVTEHRLRGEAERANRAKDEFLAIVSHELRSPLNALKGWGQVLSGLREPEAALVARAAEAIKRNVDHQTRLIEDLLDTSRVISGKLDLDVRRLNLVDVVSFARDSAREQAQAKRIELRMAPEDPVVIVEGDFDRLQQVVSNLLSNAIKFTPEGGLVQLALRQLPDAVELSVMDNGMGIPADFLPHVFDRFSQANTSLTRRYLGLGIGLALVRSLVQMHGGTVQAASAGAGQGSVFTITLPRPQVSGSGQSVLADADEGERCSLEGVLTLVVDDDPDARDVMRLMLGRAGAEVRTFDSGKALLAELDASSVAAGSSILLLDIAMPGDSGFEVLRRVREIDTLPFLPAIAVTALTHLDHGKFTLAGFQGKLGKPVDEKVLVETVIEVLEIGKSLRAEGIADG